MLRQKRRPLHSGAPLFISGPPGSRRLNDIDDDACTNACALPTCGDAIVQDDEACDDGNDDNIDVCLDACVEATCGDGAVQDGVEQCDDAGPSAACTANCTLSECGDGILNPAAGETGDGAGVSDTCAAGDIPWPRRCGSTLRKRIGVGCWRPPGP